MLESSASPAWRVVSYALPLLSLYGNGGAARALQAAVPITDSQPGKLRQQLLVSLASSSQQRGHAQCVWPVRVGAAGGHYRLVPHATGHMQRRVAAAIRSIDISVLVEQEGGCGQACLVRCCIAGQLACRIGWGPPDAPAVAAPRHRDPRG